MTMISIATLSSTERTVLMLTAYVHGTHADQTTLAHAARRIIVEHIAQSTISSLIDRKLIVSDKYAFCKGALRVAPGLLLPLLHELVAVESDKGRSSVRYAAKALLYKGRVSNTVALCCKLIDPSCEEARQHTDYYDADDFITEVGYAITNPECRYVIDRLPRHILAESLEQRLDKATENDEQLDWEYLRTALPRDTGKKPSSLYGSPRAILAFYGFLATGEVSDDLGQMAAGQHALMLAAVQALYRDDHALASKLFTKAMSLNNKGHGEKGAFRSAIANYYYVLTMLLVGTDASHRKIGTLRKKAILAVNGHLGLIVGALYGHFVTKEHISIYPREIEGLITDTEAHGLKWLLWMTLHRLGLWPKKTKEPTLTDHQPQMAYLKAELQPMGLIPVNDATAQDMGGTSVLGRLEVKALWQLTLEEVLGEATETAAATGASTAAEQATRLVYLIERDYIVPIHQRRLKNGNWSVGKRLTPSALVRLEDPCLDATDRAMMGHVDAWDYNISMRSHVFDLVGCDHVYCGTILDLRPVTIHQDTPFLIIDKTRNGQFTVSTNMDDATKSSDGLRAYKKNSDTDYAVFAPSAFERRVYERILSQRQYPAEAEPLLLKLIASIGGRTEIHSNMVVELDNLRRMSANTAITLRVQPMAGTRFQLTALVHATDGLSFVPGVGNVTVIADKDGQKVQLTRSLAKERANMATVSDKLAELGAIDEGEDWKPRTLSESITLQVEQFLPLLEWANGNAAVCNMEWPEDARLKYHPAVSGSAASISFKNKNGWFEVEGEVRIDADTVVSLRQLLEMMRSGNHRGYVRIGENEYISLSRELERALNRLDAVTTEHRSHLQMAPTAVGLIGELLDDEHLDTGHNEALLALRRRIAESTRLRPTVPRMLRADLRPYQEEGFVWMSRLTAWGAGACLADDMGLGKTLQAIALLLGQQADGASLVVAPASVVPNWRNELARFAPTLRVVTVNDSSDRTEAIASAGEGSVVLMTYAMLSIQREDLGSREWNVVCLDEAHTIKNPGTKMSKAAMELRARRKVILTGTPIQNHLSELWNLFQFINPGLLGSAPQFRSKYILPIEQDHDKERQAQLRRLVAPFLLRRTKAEVVEELPDKTEIQVPVELTDDEMAMYELHRQQAEMAVMADKTVQVSTLAEITRLRQMACSCALVNKEWKKPGSKVLAFIDLAQSLNEGGNRALVFSQFTSFFDEVRHAMDKVGLPYLYLDGATPMKQREKLVADFQNGTCPFFLISLKAGGLGLNLTGANYVVHLDPWWNPAIEQQATDRAYRIGQQQNVTVYHLISQHTIEEKIVRLHKTKRDLADSLLEGADMSHALSQEELLELLRVPGGKA